jgi:eukaryotic-like serine/threonine-protein kinase
MGEVYRAREGKAISRLNHPHICSLHDVGSSSGVDYLVMECNERARGVLPVRDRAHASRGRGASRSEAGQRDADAGCQSQDLDFGLAALMVFPSPSPVGDSTATHLTEAGVVLGTPPYMSPQQVIGKEADARSDIFAFGAILYVMVCDGAEGFSGNGPARISRGDSERPLMHGWTALLNRR